MNVCSALHQQIKKSEILFYFYYVLFFFALFIEDVATVYLDTALLAKALKIGIIGCLLVQAFVLKWKEKAVYRLLLVLAVGGAVFLASGDFFWIIVLLMGTISRHIDRERIYRISLQCLVLFTLVVLALFALGVLPDTLSRRTDFDDFSRHSFGFVHSNILPLCLFYILVYLLVIYRAGIKRRYMLLFGALDLAVYWLCGSRNAFLGILLLILYVLFFRKQPAHSLCGRAVSITARYAMLGAAALSILPSLLRSRGIALSAWYWMDRILTNRTLLGAAAIDRFGIHLLHFMKSGEYFNATVIVGSSEWNGIVLDSGYLYITVRYGVLVLLLTLLIYRALYRQHKDSPLVCAVLIVVAFINFTDNDLLSYGFLPMMVIGVQQLCAIQIPLKWKRAKRSIGDSTYAAANQCHTQHLQ